MSAHQAYFDSTADLLDAISNWNNQNAMVLFVAEDSANQIPKIVTELKKQNVQCAGGIFPEIIAGTSTYKSGFAVSTISCTDPPIVIRDENELEQKLGALSVAPSHEDGGTIIVLADGNHPHLSSFLNCLYQRFGNNWRYFGAGAGDTVGSPIPCVFSTNEGIHNDALVLAFVPGKAAVHARHGWSRLLGPIVATKSSGNTIHEINWRPAFDVYREVIEEHTGESIQPSRMSEVGVGFPLGMIREGVEDLVRLPIAVNPQGGLTVIGGVFENSVLYVLSGTADELISASSELANQCASEFNGPADQKIILDCVTRPEFLGDAFESELKAIARGLEVLGNSIPVGALSRGEIAMESGGYPQWLNKTTVIGVFE